MLFATMIMLSINAQHLHHGGHHPCHGSHLHNCNGIQWYPQDKFSMFDMSSGFDLDEMLLNLMDDDPKVEEILKGKNKQKKKKT